MNNLDHENVTSIPLPNLRVIRGESLFYDLSDKRNYSLILTAGCTHCTSLGLNNLVGMQSD